MSDISSDEVARLAVMAALDLTAAEIAQLTSELNVIVDSVANLGKVATLDVPITSHPVPLENVFRADVPEPSIDLAEVWAMAPEVEADMFVVPRMLSED
ncbi:MAG: Asp-tRNA(Asn)/Glu-tRNA(Gln) amidotransferase subunit GatC [Promicromonosporaceae bacterium]|nr:Asp-tRNA(Asn)/Glu-tRNA(Gln) amidotransferase subunit GatC [Promicromonosporaceae bacterium]